ncbi:MAG: hypothetical protein EP330_04255 [Deltaproteobacteria bacterium]|nr:MAG: hypothetical protein EP330_04255 [Deltaproteobacteria bacterium]
MAQDPAPPGPGPSLQPPTLLLRPAIPEVEGRGEAVSVELLLLVDERGQVQQVTPVSGPEPWLAQAVGLAPGLVFSPAREDGRAVAVDVPFTWTFPPPVAPLDLRIAVRSAGPGTPLAGIEVAVGEHRAYTDGRGTIELRGLPLGEHEVTVVDTGWTSAPVKVTLDGESLVELDLYASTVRSGEAVAVYRKATPSPTVRRLPREVLAEEPGAMGDPVRALQNQPGLVRTPLDTGWLLVRGGGTDDTRVFVDGVGVPLLFHLGGLTSIVHPEMVDDVAFYPSFAPAERGASLSGGAEIHTRAPEPGTRAAAGVNLAFAHAYAATAGEDRGISVAARRSYLDGVLALVLDDEAADIAPQFWDVAVRAHQDRTEAFALAIFDSAVTPGEDPDEPIVLSQTAAQAQVRTEVDVGAATASLQPWIATERRRLETDIRDERLDTVLGGARVHVGREGEDIGWAAGAEAELRDYQLTRNFGYRRARVGMVDPFARGHLRTGEVDTELHLRLETQFVQDQRPRSGLSPRLRSTWRASDELSVSAEVARTVQPANLLATVAFPEGRYFDLEQSWIGVLSATWATPTTAMTGSVWTRRFTLIGYELDGTLGPLDGRADGIELSATHHLAHLDVRGILQLARSQRREDPGDAWLPDLYDQPVRLHLQGQWHLPRRWTLGARARYASGFYNLRGLDEAFDLLTQAQIPIPDGRLAPYASLDLRVAKRWDWRTVQLTSYLDLLNASGRRIPEPAINGIDDAVVVYTYGLPFLPLFGVEGTWWKPAYPRQARERATSAR